MTEVKYKAIALTLENNIKANIYSEKLPPVRSLVAEFRVGNPTMNKALKILVQKGLIIPNGPRGNIISKKEVIRAKTNIVAIFCDTGSHDPNNDPLLDELKLRAENDDYKLLFMNTPDPNIFDDEQFWSSTWVDGYIFAYSSIKKTIARKLRSHSVPFVVANRVAPDFGANWVDFNLRKSLQTQVEALINIGRKRIMFAYSGIGLASYVEYIKQECNSVLKEYSQNCSGGFLYLPGHDITDNSQKCAKRFIQHKFDGVITTGLNPLLVEAEIAKAGLKCNSDYTMIQRGNETEIRFNKFPHIVAPYKKLADATWDLFKKVVEDHDIGVQQILVDEEFYLDLISPPNDTITRMPKVYPMSYAVAGV